MEAWYVAKTKASDMLSSPGMEALLEKVKQICDAVIVDSAPVIGCADTRSLARGIDKALLILRPEASKLDLARDSRPILEAMEARVVGLALNKVGLEECECLPHHVDKKS
jgi:Mrp family chromosome partitioning ATPase